MDDKIVIEPDDSEFDVTKEPVKTVRMLSFRLGLERYCINITDAKEVFRPVSITRIPNTPPFIIGVTSLHGEVIPLVDIRYFLGLSSDEGLGSTKVIVTDVKSSVMGVMVDDVNDALDIEEASIQPALATIKGKLAQYTIGQVQLGTDIITLLELSKILGSEEMESLKKGGRQ